MTAKKTSNHAFANGDLDSPKFDTMQELNDWMDKNPLPPEENSKQFDEFLTRFVFLGAPEPAKFNDRGEPIGSGNSGPLSKRTQYDDALFIRRAAFHKTFVLPGIRRNVPEKAILDCFDELLGRYQRHKIIEAIENALLFKGFKKIPTTRNIRKTLAKNHRWPIE